MIKITLNIPEEIVEIIKKRNGDIENYVQGVLINPLLEELEHDQKEAILKSHLHKIEKKLKEYKKQFTIKLKD